MKRRSFVKPSILTTATAVAAPAITMAENNRAGGRQFYELRVYTLKSEAQQKVIEAYYKEAAIPALNKLGSKNVGVFTELKPADQTKIYVLIPYNSLNDFLTVRD